VRDQARYLPVSVEPPLTDQVIEATPEVAR
jgi:hypothetical protein